MTDEKPEPIGGQARIESIARARASGIGGRRTPLAEINRRLGLILPLVLRGFGTSDVLRAIRKLKQFEPWGPTLSERTLDRYLSRIKNELRDSAAIDRDHMLGLALRRLTLLIRKSFAAADYATARRCQRDISELAGLVGAAYAAGQFRVSVKTPAGSTEVEIETAGSRRMPTMVERANELNRLLGLARDNGADIPLHERPADPGQN